MKHYSPCSTQRLVLTRPDEHDIDDLYRLLSDPEVWEHYPSLRHTDVAGTRAWLVRQQGQWHRDGVGTWVARLRDEEESAAFVGYGGVDRRGPVWNRGYRLVRAHWGHGYAREIAALALETAAQVRPDAPVTAYLLDHNENSKRATEALGLTQVWRGPDAGNPDPHAIRLIYADRPLDAMTLEHVVAAA